MADETTATWVIRICSDCNDETPRAGRFCAWCGFDAQNVRSSDKPEPSLQLLVIDLGDSCVVKVERGAMPHTSSDPMKDLGFYGNLSIVRATFTELREAIDSQDSDLQDSDKPERRIEYQDVRDLGWRHLLYHGCRNSPNPTILNQVEWNALTEINGKPLPIYTPTEGKWEQLANGSRSSHSNMPNIWRYTR